MKGQEGGDVLSEDEEFPFSNAWWEYCGSGGRYNFGIFAVPFARLKGL